MRTKRVQAIQRAATEQGATRPRPHPARTLGLTRLAAVGFLLSVLAVMTACAQPSPEGNTEPSQGPAAVPSTTASAAAIDLTITLTESPQATPRTFRLVAAGSEPSAESTLPDPASALSAVEKYGEKMFFPLPDPTRVCTQQYGGPEIAVVTGWFNGKAVNSTFKRTDGCEISRWRAMAPLLGGLSGGTGAI